jgi:hypothetical protein
VEPCSKGVPKLEDVQPFSRDTSIIERYGTTRPRAAEARKSARMFGRERLRSLFGRSSKP